MPIDEQVEQAMRRWPNVPAVYGWLRLDRRGRWMLIDRGRPGFDEARDAMGSEITSAPILDFLGRNYLADAQGRWYWQNGPQRVFVDLDLAPLIARVMGEGERSRLITHTGYELDPPAQGWIDQHGNVFIRTSLGPAAVHDLDLAQLNFDEPDDERALPAWVELGARRITLAPIGETDRELGFEKRPRG